MPNLDPGTIVAECKCNGCGKPVKVKLNKNRIGYYFCPWTDDDGERCNHKESWGRKASQDMQRNYLAARKASKLEPDNDNIEPAQPANLPDEPKEPKQPAADAGDGDIFTAFG